MSLVTRAGRDGAVRSTGVRSAVHRSWQSDHEVLDRLRAVPQRAVGGGRRAQLIAAVEVTQQAADNQQPRPLLDSVGARADRAPEQVSVDSGYPPEENFVSLKRRRIDGHVALDRGEQSARTDPAARRTRERTRKLRASFCYALSLLLVSSSGCVGNVWESESSMRSRWLEHRQEFDRLVMETRKTPGDPVIRKGGRVYYDHVGEGGLRRAPGNPLGERKAVFEKLFSDTGVCEIVPVPGGVLLVVSIIGYLTRTERGYVFADREGTPEGSRVDPCKVLVLSDSCIVMDDHPLGSIGHHDCHLKTLGDGWYLYSCHPM